jgi:hypothetical protein
VQEISPSKRGERERHSAERSESKDEVSATQTLRYNLAFHNRHQGAKPVESKHAESHAAEGDPNPSVIDLAIDYFEESYMRWDDDSLMVRAALPRARANLHVTSIRAR